jgi:hypothetical protein
VNAAQHAFPSSFRLSSSTPQCTSTAPFPSTTIATIATTATTATTTVAAAAAAAAVVTAAATAAKGVPGEQERLEQSLA